MISSSFIPLPCMYIGQMANCPVVVGYSVLRNLRLEMSYFYDPRRQQRTTLVTPSHPVPLLSLPPTKNTLWLQCCGGRMNGAEYRRRMFGVFINMPIIVIYYNQSDDMQAPQNKYFMQITRGCVSPFQFAIHAGMSFAAHIIIILGGTIGYCQGL